MGSKKKDLEIIYNLQWKNKPSNEGDKANIIGMYDIPATTLNWEIFKSYLLKNSGAVGEDVKVSYITDSNREFPIESQTDFQIALYAFRRKARIGGIVNLKLEKVSKHSTHKNTRHSNDVETQFDNNEAVSLSVSTCCNNNTTPEWFVTYMSQFKKNITEELTATISSIVSNIKPHTVSIPSCYHARKSKAECPKRIRKHPSLVAEPSHESKEFRRSLKLEGKLEKKLDKLEHKTMKILEKKFALFNRPYDQEAGPSNGKTSSHHCENKDESFKMDATPVNSQSVIPHMLGGEIYLHQWEVKNTGQLPWTSKTSLIFTWGSKALKPVESIISVPHIKPGEIGTLAVRLQVPNHPGQYECYWYFHHKGRRFGHWLGCQIIVDPFDLKGNKSVLETSFMTDFNTSTPKKFKANDRIYDQEEPVPFTASVEPNQAVDYTFNIEHNSADKEKSVTNLEEEDSAAEIIFDKFVRDISARVEDIKFQDPTDTNCSSDSDNQSIISLSESNSSRSLPEEFVVVPIPDCFKVDQIPVSSNISTQEENVKEANIETTSVDKSHVLIPQGSSLLQSSSNFNTQNKIITDETVSINSSSKQSEDVKLNSEHSSDNYDNNNNTEETNQNSAISESRKIEEDESSNDESQKSDMVFISLSNEKEIDGDGYAYVIVDGQKLPIPKKMIKSEYLKSSVSPSSSVKDILTPTNSATSSVEIVNREDEISQQRPNEITTDIITELSGNSHVQDNEIVNQVISSECNADLLSHCSATGTCFSEVGSEPEMNSGTEKNSRIFIFPQNCPGFEVIPNQTSQTNVNTNHSSGIPNQYFQPMNANDNATYIQIDHGTPYVYPVYNNTPSAPIQTTTTTTNIPPLNLSTHDRNPFTTETTIHCQPISSTARTAQPEGGSSVNTCTRQSVTATYNTAPSAPENTRPLENAVPVHILPETLVSGAVNVASSAINTARSVINMIVPREPGRWVNGHWVSTNPETPREANLQALAEMGFWNRDLNATLLARYNDDLSRVVAELVQ